MQLPQPLPLPHFDQQIISRESSTQSENSSESGVKRVKQITSITKKQLDDLNTKVKEEISTNKKRFQKLLALNPYFSMKLYAPVNTYSQDEHHTGTLRKMMNQIDMLLEEGNLIEKQIKKSELKRMQSDYLDPTERNQIKNHYAYLRKIWLDFSKNESNNSSSITDKIQELNKKVVIIKNNIFTVTQHEKRCYQYQGRYQNVDKKIREMVYQTDEYNLLKQRFENLNMVLQQSENRFSDLCERYENKLSQKDLQIIRLTRDSQQQRRINKQLKQKIMSNEKKEMKLQEKIGELENEIKLKAKLYSNMKENNETQNNLKMLKQQNYIGQIKFRKIDFDTQSRRNNFDLKQYKETVSQKTINEEDASTQRPLFVSLPTINDRQVIEADEKLDASSCEETKERNLLRENKSIEARKGRFTRMRSPGNVKLMKPREEEHKECLSPRLRDIREDDNKSLAGISTCQ